MSSYYLEWWWPQSGQIEWWWKYLRTPSFILAFVVAALNTTLFPLPERLGGFTSWWRERLWRKGWATRIVLFLMLINFMASFGWAFVFYPVFLAGIWFFSSGFRSNIKQDAVVSENTHGLIWGFANLCGSIYLFATLTYPLIPPYVGGGKPLLVSLALKPEHRYTLGQIMGREDWKCVMHNISLIHENSELVYVLPHGYLANDSAIAIPKSELISIAYQKKENSEHSTCLEK